MTMFPATLDFLALPELPLRLTKARRFLDQEAEKRDQFRDAIRPHEKCGLINGEIIMHSPARESHNHVSSLVVGISGTYARANHAGVLRYEKALRGFSRNDYEPDIIWFGPEKAASLTPDTMVNPIPDFIVEILSPSTESRDRGVKMEDYAARGVREYWIIDAEKRTVEQYLLAEDAEEYHLAEKFNQGAITPFSLPGLAIPLAAMFEDSANTTFLRTFF